MADIMKMGENPKYLGSWDLEGCDGGMIAVTIKNIVDEEVTANGQKESCTVCYFTENIKPMILNITNKKTLARLHKTTDTAKLAGKRFFVHVEKVRAFGEIWDALRIVKGKIPPTNAPASVTVKCERCGADIKPIAGMSSEQTAAYTKQKYHAALCASCATEAKRNLEEMKEEEII